MLDEFLDISGWYCLTLLEIAWLISWYWKMILLNIARYCLSQIYHNMTWYCMLLRDIAFYCKILQDIALLIMLDKFLDTSGWYFLKWLYIAWLISWYWKIILLNIARYCLIDFMILQDDIAWYCSIFFFYLSEEGRDYCVWKCLNQPIRIIRVDRYHDSREVPD